MTSFADRVISSFKRVNITSMKEIHDQLITAAESEWNQIPESIFVSQFLDLFMNGIDSNPDKLINWITVAGNLRFGVHVISDTTGERLFTVPPVYDTSIFSATPGESMDESIAKHAAVYDLLTRNRPSQAQAYFDRHMAAVLKKKIVKPTSGAWVQFADLLNRYSGGKNTQHTIKQTEKTDIVYDEGDVL